MVELLGLEYDANVFQDCQRYETLVWAKTTTVADDILYRIRPARVGRVESYDSDAHAEPLENHLVIRWLASLAFSRRPHQLKQLASQLDNMRVFLRQVPKVFVELLKQGLRTNKMFLETLLLSWALRRHIRQQFKRYSPNLLARHQLHNKLICSGFLLLGLAVLDLVVMVQYGLTIKLLLLRLT